MASKLLLLSLLSCFAALAQAVNGTTVTRSVGTTSDERALWQAIMSRGPSTFVLTKDIILSADLPLLAHTKILVVRSAAGATYKIDGGNKYHIFRSAGGARVTLELTNIVLTKAIFAAVDLVTESVLTVVNVKFLLNARALNLYLVTGTITNSTFFGHSKTAIYVGSQAGSIESVYFSHCAFVNNKAVPGENGGAIQVKFGDVIADQCSFERNSAAYGGAASFDQSNGRFSKCAFLNNRAKYSGGAVASMENAFVAVFDTNFYYNVAETGGAGGVLVSSASKGSVANFYRVSFQRNTAALYGPAFVLEGGNAAGKFCSTSFWGNSANGTVSTGFLKIAEGAANKLVYIRPGRVVPGLRSTRGVYIQYQPAICSPLP